MNPRSPSYFLSSIVVHGAFFSALAAAPTEVEPSPVSRTIEFITITEEGGGRLGNDETIGDAAKVPETPPERLFQKVQPKPKPKQKPSDPVAAAAPKAPAPSVSKKPIEPVEQGEAAADDAGSATRVATAKGSAGTDAKAERSGVGSGAEGVDRRSALRAWLSEVQREVNKIATRNYPRSAIRMRLEGRLRLGVTIAPDGTILGVRVLSSSGHTVLDDSATASVNALHIPPPPEALGWRAREISLPVRYALD